MKRRYSTALALLWAIWCFSAPARATDRTFTDNDGTNSSFNNAGNWNPNDNFPQAGDTATIPNGKFCNIENQNHDCDSIDVQSGGFLTIKAGRSLRIAFDSIVDGTIRTTLGNLGCPCDPADPFAIAATLGLDSSLTISGEGVIVGGCAGCAAPLILANLATADAGVTLTLSDAAGALTLKNFVDVRLPLVNDAHALVDLTGQIMSLTDQEKSGDGIWEVTTGKLRVDVAVTGDASWRMAGANSVIEINADVCTGGDIQFESGLFQVNRDATTFFSVDFIHGGNNTFKLGDAEASDTLEIDVTFPNDDVVFGGISGCN